MTMRNNTRLLSLFFFLPEEIVVRFPQAQSLPLPTFPYEAFHTDRFANLPGSPAFTRFIQETYAREAWQSFHFSNGKGVRKKTPGCYDDYADSFMLRQLALQACKPIAEKLAQTGYSAERLSGMATGETMPRPSVKQFHDEIAGMMASIIEEQNWQPIIDLACKDLTPDDYSRRYSNARIDAERKWRHSRVREGAPLSLEALQERRRPDSAGFDIPDTSYDPSSLFDKVEDDYGLLSGVTDAEDTGELDDSDIYHGEEIDGDYKTWDARKLAEYRAQVSVYNSILHSPLGHTLSEKDREMLRLRKHDTPVTEIAQKLGYKSHSTVVKRLNKLAGQYRGTIPTPAKQQAAMDKWLDENYDSEW